MQDPYQRAASLLERVARLIQSDAHNSGLLPVQWEVLRYLSSANRFSCTPSALTQYLHSTKGTVSQTLNVLERKGLLVKSAAPGDRRSVRLSLSHQGRELLREDTLGLITRSIHQLSSEQRVAEFVADLEQIIRGRLEQRGGQTFGLCKTCRYFRDTPDAETPHRCELLNEPLLAGEGELICAEQQA